MKLPKVDWKKIILPAIAVTIFGFIWGWLTCGWLFNWVYTLEPTSIWKPSEAMNTNWFILMNLGGLVLNLALVWVYALLLKAIPGKGIYKGLWYGFFVWLAGTLPGMFSLYMTMVIAQTVVVYWLVNGLISSLIAGAIIAAVYKE